MTISKALIKWKHIKFWKTGLQCGIDNKFVMLLNNGFKPLSKPMIKVSHITKTIKPYPVNSICDGNHQVIAFPWYFPAKIVEKIITASYLDNTVFITSKNTTVIIELCICQTKTIEINCSVNSWDASIIVVKQFLSICIVQSMDYISNKGEI